MSKQRTASLRVVVKSPGEAAREASIPDTLQGAQAAVAGLIDVIRVADGLDVVINDEGLLHRMPHNFTIVGDFGPVPIVGPAFFVAVAADGDFQSLSDEQVATIAARWLAGHVFIAPHIELDIDA